MFQVRIHGRGGQGYGQWGQPIGQCGYCKGCGLCASECPCGAIKMIPEDV